MNTDQTDLSVKPFSYPFRLCSSVGKHGLVNDKLKFV
jgi:hypothetical protein